MALVALGLAALVDAVVEAPARGWAVPRTLALFAVGAVALGGFVVWERYASAPMIPLRLLRIRVFAAANVANMFSSAATFSAAYVMTQYFQFGRGDSPLGTGLRFLPWTAMPLIFAPLAGAWSDRLGARRLAVPGLVMQAAGFAAIVVLAGTAQPWAAYAGPFVVAGIGVSLALPTLPTAALSVVAPAEIGVAAGRGQHGPTDRPGHRRRGRQRGLRRARLAGLRIGCHERIPLGVWARRRSSR